MRTQKVCDWQFITKSLLHLHEHEGKFSISYIRGNQMEKSFSLSVWHSNPTFPYTLGIRTIVTGEPRGEGVHVTRNRHQQTDSVHDISAATRARTIIPVKHAWHAPSV